MKLFIKTNPSSKKEDQSIRNKPLLLLTTEREDTPPRVLLFARTNDLARANAWSETAVPEGRQAEWNGARLRSKLKQGGGPSRRL